MHACRASWHANLLPEQAYQLSGLPFNVEQCINAIKPCFYFTISIARPCLGTKLK